MIIIGEKINGAIPSVAKAIKERDDAHIRNLVKRQVEAGVDYLDVCAGTSVDQELEVLNWLLSIVQEETDTPLSVDSPDANIIRSVLPNVKRVGIINSVSGEGDKCEILYPLMKDNDWKIIALTCDDDGIPDTSQKKIDIAVRLIEEARKYDLEPDRIYIDPLVMTLSVVNDSMLIFMETIREIKRLYPGVKTTSGLSNISYGMPYRKIINLNFLTLALSAGMDSAIIDPTNRDLYATILATEALLNKDKHCRNFSRAYRQGKIGPAGKGAK